MSPSAPAPPVSPRNKTSWFLRVLALLLAAFALALAINLARIAWQEGEDEVRQADVIVIFGAAEYSGRPSPVFRSRLDHAVALYKRGLAPIVIATGGAGDDPKFSEGGVGRDYLVAQGIPEPQIIAETQGDNTAESVERVAQIMRANKMRTCLAVSDGYHIFRIKQMLATQGITAYGAPRPAKPVGRWTQLENLLHEDLSYTLWRVGITF